MGKTSKGRGLPEKGPKNGENEKRVRSSPKCDKVNMGWVLMVKWVKLVRLGVGH